MNKSYNRDNHSTRNEGKSIKSKKSFIKRTPKYTGIGRTRKTIVYKNKLTRQAEESQCYTSLEMKSLYPNNALEMSVWIRSEKEENCEHINNKKTKVSVYLIRLECSNDYSMALYTFQNKYTGNIFQLDYKYYGKLWWLFK